MAKRRTKRAESKKGRERTTRSGQPPGRLEAEAVALGLFALAIFLEVALLTYDPADPLWSFGQTVANRFGPIGALLAGVLAGSLGWAAHCLPIAALIIGARYLRGLPIRPRWIPIVSWSAFIILLAATAGAFHLLAPERIAATAGGSVGDWTAAMLRGALYVPGTLLVLTIGLILSFLVATGGSMRDAGQSVAVAVEKVRRQVVQLAEVSWARFRMRMDRVAEARELKPERSSELARPTMPVVPERLKRSKSYEPEVVEHQIAAPKPQRQADLPFPQAGPKGPFKLPDLEMLAQGADYGASLDRDSLIQNSQILEKKLADFGVNGRVVKVHPGPVVTMYEYEPAPGVKVSRIVSLSDDLALALRAISIRIVAPIPGKNVVGIEVPNQSREVVVIRDLLAHPTFFEAESKLIIPLGKDIFGNPIVADLAKMPHLLVAGATGSGKSVFLNALLCSIFFKATPQEVQLLLVDPKMLEFAMFKNIPHLISEVVTNPKRAASALMGVVAKMEDRYKLMSQLGVRNIAQYNKAVRKDKIPIDDSDQLHEPLPYIVVMIDELADLMIVASRDVEESLIRLAQMARAAGIHLVLATQRPSVDVLTGLIKANFPARISFQVSSRIDSRTILDSNGAERLLGMGDLLFLPPGSSKLERIHGPYISDNEVQTVTDFLRGQGEPKFDPTLVRMEEAREEAEARGGEYDDLFDEAVDVVSRHRIASISFVQRRLKIGYNRAARIVEQMELDGMVGPQEGTKPREIFLRPVDEA